MGRRARHDRADPARRQVAGAREADGRSSAGVHGARRRLDRLGRRLGRRARDASGHGRVGRLEDCGGARGWLGRRPRPAARERRSHRLRLDAPVRPVHGASAPGDRDLPGAAARRSRRRAAGPRPRRRSCAARAPTAARSPCSSPATTWSSPWAPPRSPAGTWKSAGDCALARTWAKSIEADAAKPKLLLRCGRGRGEDEQGRRRRGTVHGRHVHVHVHVHVHDYDYDCDYD